MTLSPDARVVVCNRKSMGSRSWARVLAQRLDQGEHTPNKTLRHTAFAADGEYKSTFLLDDSKFCQEVGRGLEGKTVYIVSDDSSRHDRQALSWHNIIIAETAKYNGAASVVLVQPSLYYAAQERGVHDVHHSRMQDPAARKKFNGEGPTLRFAAKHYKAAGIDHILTAHSHCPDDIQHIFQDVYERDDVVFDLDLSALIGLYFGKGLIDGASQIQDGGANIVFVAPDAGAAPFVDRVMAAAQLPHASAIYGLKSRKDEKRVNVQFERWSDNFTGYAGKTIICLDDMIRTGGTLATNIELLYDSDEKPGRVIIYAAHSHLGEAADRLNIPSVRDIVVTNTMPTVLQRCGELDEKLTLLDVTGYLADAVVRCVENKVSPQDAYPLDLVERMLPRLVRTVRTETHYSA